MLTFKGVAKRYGEIAALQPMDLQFSAEETTVLIGPSGCGKSTLLRLIAGLVKADEGEISFNGTAQCHTDGTATGQSTGHCDSC